MIWEKKDKKTEDLSPEKETTEVAPEESTLVIEDEEKGAESIANKLKKIKAELEKCKEEKQEYLIGWQRCKADSINARKDAILTAERAGSRAKNTLIEDIIPALDSFDMAVGSESWGKLDAGWRSGMENVRSQLISALNNHGVQIYGAVSEVFDPTIHEAVEEVESEGPHGTISRVHRRGYKLNGNASDSVTIIRPAQVSVTVAKKTGHE